MLLNTVAKIHGHIPNSRHRGSYYHFMQVIWRKIQALGLTDNYCDPQDPTLKHFVQKVAAISICPSAFVHTAWLGVQQEAPQIARVDKLVDYFTSTWVRTVYSVYDGCKFDTCDYAWYDLIN